MGIRLLVKDEAHNLEDLFPLHNRSGLGVNREYERMGNKPVSDELQARANIFGVEFEHLGITLGTVIHNVDLKGVLSQELIQFIRDTLLERKVIFFRDQNLTEDEQVAFGRRFGDLDAFPFGKSGANPFILEINHGENSPGTENGWHTDVTWMEKPSLGSIAQCIIVPPVGGDTLFSDSHACYLGLPPGVQERLQQLCGVNDYRIFLMGKGSTNIADELTEEIKDEIPFGVSHPLLRTHPETGKTGLYIHGGFLRHDSLYDVRTGETLEPCESKDIVGLLLQQHAKPEYTCRFKWEAGSMAFWDNRAVQHYAASDYYPHKRLLRRVTVSGDQPFYDPTSMP
jgi:taurine dioxygenase